MESEGTGSNGRSQYLGSHGSPGGCPKDNEQVAPEEAERDVDPRLEPLAPPMVGAVEEQLNEQARAPENGEPHQDRSRQPRWRDQVPSEEQAEQAVQHAEQSDVGVVDEVDLAGEGVSHSHSSCHWNRLGK